MQCDIVSAEAQIYSGSVELLVATGAEGELGVGFGHAALLTRLIPGPIRVVEEGGEEQIYYASGGFIEVQGDVVTVLAKPLAFHVFVSPTVEKPARSVGASNMAVAAAVRSWNPMLARATSMKSGLSAEKTAELQKLLASLEDENQRLRAEGRKLKSTNKVLASTCAIERKRVKRLTEQVRLYSGGSTGQARWQGAEMALKESKAGSSAACSIQ